MVGMRGLGAAVAWGFLTVSNSDLGNGVEPGSGGLYTPRTDTGVYTGKWGAISRVHNEYLKQNALNCYMLDRC